MKFTNHEFTRFVFFGGINTLLGYLIYAILLLFLTYPISYTVSYALSIFVSYYLNSKFVFNSGLSLKKAFQYPLVYLVQYLLGILFLYVLVEIVSVHKLIAPGFVVLLTVPVTYSLSRLIIKDR